MIFETMLKTAGRDEYDVCRRVAIRARQRSR